MENLQIYANLFNIICNNFDGADLGKKAVQKIFYFFERYGLELNLRYGIHYYGPYSSKLDSTLHVLESENYIKIDTSGTTHIITLGKELITDSLLSPENEKIAMRVINDFAHKTPLELEALATMDFVAHTMSNMTRNDIIDNFKTIKGKKFSQTVINDTYATLLDLDLIKLI